MVHGDVRMEVFVCRPCQFFLYHRMELLSLFCHSSGACSDSLVSSENSVVSALFSVAFSQMVSLTPVLVVWSGETLSFAFYSTFCKRLRVCSSACLWRRQWFGKWWLKDTFLLLILYCLCYDSKLSTLILLRCNFSGAIAQSCESSSCERFQFLTIHSFIFWWVCARLLSVFLACK